LIQEWNENSVSFKSDYAGSSGASQPGFHTRLISRQFYNRYGFRQSSIDSVAKNASESAHTIEMVGNKGFRLFERLSN
jgi:hypothetical protein